MSGQVRRDPRLSAIVLQARYRCLGDEEWLRAELRDMSIGGALVTCKERLNVGQRLQLMMQRPSDHSEIELVAEVLRLVERAEGPAAGVRFMQLTKEAAGY